MRRVAGQIIEGPIAFQSLCEHHALPFYGFAHIGYIAGDEIIGISKLTRLVRLFARRFTVQERLGEQIADTLVELIAPRASPSTSRPRTSARRCAASRSTRARSRRSGAARSTTPSCGASSCSRSPQQRDGTSHGRRRPRLRRGRRARRRARRGVRSRAATASSRQSTARPTTPSRPVCRHEAVDLDVAGRGRGALGTARSGEQPRWVVNAVGGFRPARIADSEPDDVRFLHEREPRDRVVVVPRGGAPAGARRGDRQRRGAHRRHRRRRLGRLRVAKAGVVRLTQVLADELAERASASTRSCPR